MFGYIKDELINNLLRIFIPKEYTPNHHISKYVSVFVM